MKTNLAQLFYLLIIVLVFVGCEDNDDDPTPMVEAPATYEFTRNGQSSVSFDGQTTRIKMSTELIGAMMNFGISSEDLLLQMFRNSDDAGGEVSPFADASLNASTKSIKSKTAASRDYFSANTATAFQIKEQFESWMSGQINEIFPAENNLAEAGVPGQIADGSSTRYINSQGLEYNQLVNKGLIGALMTDQMLNNYLSPSVLDDGNSVSDNDAEVLESGKNYTFMEHKWDEAYGYLYGTAADLANPNATIGQDDAFLNKYVGRVEGDPDFTGIAATLFDAFKLGRAAIVEGAYDIRDEQAAIIRTEVSKIIAIRAVYYLQQAKLAIDQSTPNYGPAFHDLSEGYGFIYSLQFTREPGTNSPYFSTEEVNGFITDLLDDGANGLWDVTPATLDTISEAIAARFSFTVAQAASTN